MPLAGNGDRGQWSQDIRINASICTDDSGHRAGEGNFSSAACLSAELSRDGRYSRISANLRLFLRYGKGRRGDGLSSQVLT
jgi:hypothetical protein